ncbi:MAG: hypothetical protein AB1529_06045 [Candidatus Micrarchaeota archaeon]
MKLHMRVFKESRVPLGQARQRMSAPLLDELTGVHFVSKVRMEGDRELEDEVSGRSIGELAERIRRRLGEAGLNGNAGRIPEFSISFETQTRESTRLLVGSESSFSVKTTSRLLNGEEISAFFNAIEKIVARGLAAAQ